MALLAPTSLRHGEVRSWKGILGVLNRFTTSGASSSLEGESVTLRGDVSGSRRVFTVTRGRRRK